LTLLHTEQGWTAEEIAYQFDMLSLADVYAVIAFYLRQMLMMSSVAIAITLKIPCGLRGFVNDKSV